MNLTWKKSAFAAALLLFSYGAQAQNLSKKEMQTRLLALEQQNATLKQAMETTNTELQTLRTEIGMLKEKSARMETTLKSVPQKMLPENAGAKLKDETNLAKLHPESTSGGSKTIDATKSTSIAFAETTYDFGKIKEGEKAIHVYQFKNTGDIPLTITAARGSCGCTVPEFSKEPIAPGASGEIKVQFDSTGKSGSQAKTVTITANTNPAETVITIKGEVEKKASN